MLIHKVAIKYLATTSISCLRKCSRTTPGFVCGTSHLVKNCANVLLSVCSHSTMSGGDTPLLNVLFVLGKPGSGKGTQCDRIINEFKLCRHLSAGDLLREKRKENDETSELIENYIKEGKIVPVEITISLLQKAMEKQQSAVNMCDRLLFFNISDEVATERCLARGAGGSGRTDDNVESLKKRLNTYKETATVIDQYRQQNIVSEFKGEGTVDEIYSKVRDVITSTLSKCS